MKILIVDDDLRYCRMLRLWLHLESNQDVICELHSRSEVEENLESFDDVDIAIIDRNVSEENDGLVIEQEIKSICHCTTVGLTAFKGTAYGDRFFTKDEYSSVIRLIEEVRREKYAA